MGVKEEGKDQEAEDQSQEDDDQSPEPDDSEEDDSSEEEGEEDEGSEDEAAEDGDSGEEGESKKQSKTPNFFDPKNLDPKLKPVWNAMQASFTRQVQRARLSSRKAAAYDQLVANPEFRKWVEDYRASLSGNQGSRTRQRQNGKDSREPDAIRAMVDEAVSKAIKPYEEREREAQRSQTKREFKRFKQRHPDWTLYQDRMDEIMEENPNLNYTRAYRLAKAEVSDDDDQGNGRGEDRDYLRRRKKRANVGQSGGSSVDKGKQRKEIGSIFDAYDEAKADLAKRK